LLPSRRGCFLKLKWDVRGRHAPRRIGISFFKNSNFGKRRNMRKATQKHSVKQSGQKSEPEVVYTQEFWDRALELVDAEKRCEQCRRLHNQERKPRVLVGLVLTGDGTPLPERLHLLCNACLREIRPPRPRPRIIRKPASKIAELPFPHPNQPREAVAA
jgi:hypothetical protein